MIIWKFLAYLDCNARIFSRIGTKEMVEQQFATEISYMITNSSELIPRLDMGLCRKSLWRTLLPNGTETLIYM